MPSKSREMVLVAFIQAANCSNYPGSWRHPEADHSFLTPQYYQNIAETLESGKFHLAFLDDRLAMPSQYRDSYEDAVRYGIRSVKLDLIPIMTAMGLATHNLGIGGTYSTSYYQPFHVARLFATLDHMTGGRSAWNVVTSLNDAEAQNFGLNKHMTHDDRYNQADEFMEVVTGLWGTWGEDALLLDATVGEFADPSKVKRLDHAGKWFNSRGPLTVPRSPQGRPVIIQAGQSLRGREFAAKWAELVFVIFPTLQANQEFYSDIKNKAKLNGRDSNDLLVAPAVYVVVAQSEREAEEKLHEIETLSTTIDSLSLLSEVFNYDFSLHPLDEPLSDDILDSMTGLRGFLDRVVELSGKRNPTVQDFITHSGRGTVKELPVFVGSPNKIADEMAYWFNTKACDGFVVAATHVPGTYEDFCEMVVPELQSRGVFHEEYSGTMLRDSLGLA
ncbi:MAG: LLM class flavin-dependent oxidoreductase [Chloroflexota bacterium]|nr:LLM class flavin-dependent oxidoreductase [Chloroflexota bacterium]